MPDSGAYRVKESGLEFDHGGTTQSQPTTAEAFLGNVRKNFTMCILDRPSKNDLVLELLNVDVSFCNALRRILLAEIPTMAIENIYLWNNSSLLHDEVLSHRLGLIPFNADARLFEVVTDQTPATDQNTLVFGLQVTCPKKPPASENTSSSSGKRSSGNRKVKREGNDSDSGDDNYHELGTTGIDPDLTEAAAQVAKQRPYVFPKDRPYTMHVYSKDLVWMPQGRQEERFGKNSIRPLHDDILIAKLRPGQTIQLEAHVRHGVGKDHAKFSPVATASYRLMPHIEILHDVYDDDAKELVHVYEPGVFDLVPTDPAVDPPNTTVKAKLVNPYACTMSRNFMRHAVLAKSIRISRLPNHFIFSIESVGMYDPGVLLAEALRTLQGKCRRVMDLADDTNVV